MSTRCPGQDSRNLTAAFHRCPNCGAMVEIFSDEQRQRCPECKTMVFTEETPSCVQWCTAARDCLGPERYQRFMEALGRTDRPAAGEDGSDET
ncbi:MAG: phosphohydrolase [Phycisphaerae bacterium]|nr:phosphohydrolase [Phycisphaerae bacterium]